MIDLLKDKITRWLSMSSEHGLFDEDTVALTNYLYECDAIRHRVLDKTDLRNVVLEMRKGAK